MTLVLDSSTALTWCLPDQTSPFSKLMFEECHRSRVLVPSIWHLEMANVLGLKLRDGNLSPQSLEQALALLSTLPIESSPTAQIGSIQTNLERIRRHRVAAYDALYIDLALETGSSLVTYDKAMARAARLSAVTVLAPE